MTTMILRRSLNLHRVKPLMMSGRQTSQLRRQLFPRHLRLLSILLLLLEVLLRSRVRTYGTESRVILDLLSLERARSHSALTSVLWSVVGWQLLELVQLILHLCHFVRELVAVDVIVILILCLFSDATVRFIALGAQDGLGNLPLVTHLPKVRKFLARRCFSVGSHRIILFIPILKSHAICHSLIQSVLTLRTFVNLIVGLR